MKTVLLLVALCCILLLFFSFPDLRDENVQHGCGIFPLDLLFNSKRSLRTYKTKSSAIYLEEDGISILNRELTLLIM